MNRKGLHLWAACAYVCTLMTGCNPSSASRDNIIEYRCVETSSSPRKWGILEAKTGRVLYPDSIWYDTGNIVDGSFFLPTPEREYNLYNVKDITQPLNKEPVTGWTQLNPEGLSIVAQGSRPLAIMDTEGNIRAQLPEEIVAAHPFSADGLAAVCNADGRWGYVDTNGKVVIEAKYGCVDSFSGGRAFVSYSEPSPGYKRPTGAVCVIDKDGKELCEINVKEYLPFSDGYAAVETDGEVYVLKDDGTLGNRLTMISSLRAGGSVRNSYIIYYNNGRAGLTDIEDNDLIYPGRFNYLKFVDDNTIVAGLSNGNWEYTEYGVIDYQGNEVMSFDDGKIEALGNDRYIWDKPGRDCIVINSQRECIGDAFDGCGQYFIGQMVVQR